MCLHLRYLPLEHVQQLLFGKMAEGCKLALEKSSKGYMSDVRSHEYKELV